MATSDYDRVIADVYLKYQARLAENSALDFDDIIFKTVLLFKEHPHVLEKYQAQFTHILVDEFQDTNTAQYFLAKMLSARSQNITVVGDFSQSIYSWRGADIKNLKKIEADFPDTQVFHLEQNYRSTQKVLDFAYDIIHSTSSHPVLSLFTENEPGEDVEIKQLDNEQDEGVFIAHEVMRIVREGGAYDECAVLYRMNAQSRVIEEAFLHYGIPYVLIGGTRFYERKEIKDMLSYLRLLINSDDEISRDRVMKVGKGRFKKFMELRDTIYPQLADTSTDRLIELVFDATGYAQLYDPKDPQDQPRIENLKELRSVAMQFPQLTEFLHQVALVESEYSENERHNQSKSGVRLMTMHQAKGLEFLNVFIVGLEEGILPHSRSIYDSDELEEERRLLYVGITRAKKKLYLTYVVRRFMFGKRMFVQPSRFLDKHIDTHDFARTF